MEFLGKLGIWVRNFRVLMYIRDFKEIKVLWGIPKVWKDPRVFEGIKWGSKRSQGVTKCVGGIPGSLKKSQEVCRDPSEFEGIPVSLKGSQ